MGKKSILLEEIGECTFIKSKRSKKIRIKVEPNKPVVTYIPPYISFEFAYKFVISKKEWLKKAKLKIAEIEKQKTIFTKDTIFSTRSHKLSIKYHPKPNIKADISNGSINIYFPLGTDMEKNEIQEFIQKAIIEAYRIEAKEILPLKLKELALRYNYQYNKVFIKNLKSRWGSCSSRNNINLNLHLVRLPEHLMEYVILHELVHTVHKNHGMGFWQELNKLVGNAKVLQRQLRNYSIEV